MTMRILSGLVFLLLAASLSSAARAGRAGAPASVFDLREWKITLPGPKEIKDLKGYSSDYFYLNAQKEMCFHLDASEKGTTPTAKYVRSELRHLPNWGTGESRALSAEVRATSSLKPDKVTVVQIHGITEDKKDAPPLLRVALQDGDLFALLKTSSSNEKNSPEEKILLRGGLGGSFVKIDVRVEEGQLSIAVDGKEMLRRDLGFWKFLNYFKAGCYPQATEGVADVAFRRLSVQ
jgi:Alginate lyase